MEKSAVTSISDDLLGHCWCEASNLNKSELQGYESTALAVGSEDTADIEASHENHICMHDHAQIRKIQSIFVHAVHARGLPAWLAAEMVRSADFDPRARRQAEACAQN